MGKLRHTNLKPVANKFRSWRRGRYQDLKARGKCVSCGWAFAQGGVRCRVCALAILETVERSRARRAQRRADLGTVCQSCGGPVMLGRFWCFACQSLSDMIQK